MHRERLALRIQPNEPSHLTPRQAPFDETSQLLRSAQRVKARIRPSSTKHMLESLPLHEGSPPRAREAHRLGRSKVSIRRANVLALLAIPCRPRNVKQAATAKKQRQLETAIAAVCEVETTCDLARERRTRCETGILLTGHERQRGINRATQRLSEKPPPGPP